MKTYKIVLIVLALLLLPLGAATLLSPFAGCVRSHWRDAGTVAGVGFAQLVCDEYAGWARWKR